MLFCPTAWRRRYMLVLKRIFKRSGEISGQKIAAISSFVCGPDCRKKKNNSLVSLVCQSESIIFFSLKDTWPGPKAWIVKCGAEIKADSEIRRSLRRKAGILLVKCSALVNIRCMAADISAGKLKLSNLRLTCPAATYNGAGSFRSAKLETNSFNRKMAESTCPEAMKEAASQRLPMDASRMCPACL